jgi:hypothetical protein
MFASRSLPDPGTGLRVLVSSDFREGMHLYNGLVYEACTAISSMAGGELIAPESLSSSPARKIASGLKRLATGTALANCETQKVRDECDLFLYICMRPDNLANLAAIHDWRRKSRVAAAYLFETWSARVAEYGAYLRLLDNFDYVFLFNPGSVAAVQRFTTAKCVYLPAAVDCLIATPFPDPPSRPIDVYGMGRTDERVHEQLVDMSQDNQLFYVWDRGPGLATTGFAQARTRTYHLIRHSRFFTSFNFTVGGVKLRESAGEEAIPARVFEGTAAGAVLIGLAPNVPEFGKLFDWPDALIEIPTDPVDMRSFYSELQADPERIRRAGIVNATQALRRHDWAYRFEAMLDIMGLPIPDAVCSRKRRLSQLAEIADSYLPANSGQEVSFGEIDETGSGQPMPSFGSSYRKPHSASGA